jgi:hypothetical protein
MPASANAGLDGAAPSQLRASAAETAMMIPSAMALAKRYTWGRRCNVFVICG